MQDHLYRLGRRFSNLPALGEQVGAPVLQFTLFYRAHQQTLTSKHFTYCCHIIILQKAHTTIIHFCPHTRFAGQKNNLYNGKG